MQFVNVVFVVFPDHAHFLLQKRNKMLDKHLFSPNLFNEFNKAWALM